MNSPLFLVAKGTVFVTNLFDISKLLISSLWEPKCRVEGPLLKKEDHMISRHSIIVSFSGYRHFLPLIFLHVPGPFSFPPKASFVFLLLASTHTGIFLPSISMLLFLCSELVRTSFCSGAKYVTRCKCRWAKDGSLRLCAKLRNHFMRLHLSLAWREFWWIEKLQISLICLNAESKRYFWCEHKCESKILRFQRVRFRKTFYLTLLELNKPDFSRSSRGQNEV